MERKRKKEEQEELQFDSHCNYYNSFVWLFSNKVYIASLLFSLNWCLRVLHSGGTVCSERVYSKKAQAQFDNRNPIFGKENYWFNHKLLFASSSNHVNFRLVYKEPVCIAN